jgi:small subunit ribosomal protein S20
MEIELLLISICTREVKRMPNIKSAIKRVKTSNEHRAQNASVKSTMRTAVKSVDALVTNNELDKAKVALVEASKKLDKAARQGLIHKNAAARQKSRLAKKVNSANA